MKEEEKEEEKEREERGKSMRGEKGHKGKTLLIPHLSFPTYTATKAS